MFSRSLRLGRIATIDVRLHWSLILGYAFFYLITPGTGVRNLTMATTVMVSVFLSITAHEFGHALVARRFGCATRQIVLWMLGGLALFEREPRRTSEKILIALAGPLVNLAIAGLCFGLGVALTTLISTSRSVAFARFLYTPLLPSLSIVQIGSMVVAINVVLALFNLLPVYPLDGGRVLRAALAPRLGERRADQVALLIAVAVISALLAFFGRQRDWLSFGETLLLLLVASTLHPWFNRQLTLAGVWWLHRGSYYAFARQDYDRALAYADQQIASGRRLGEHYVLRSYVMLKTGDLAAAWVAADQAARLPGATNVERAMALNNRGVIACLQGNLVEAQPDLDAAIQANPQLAYAYDTRGDLAARLGDSDKALADLNAALELAPQFIEARYHRAELLFARGELEGARADAAFAFAAGHDDMLDWSEVELRHILSGRLAWAQQVVAWVDPTWSASRTQRFLGDALRVNGHPAEAVAAYGQALATSPTDATLLLRRAWAYQACGMPQQARADSESALAAKPTPNLRKRAIALLDTLASAAISSPTDPNLLPAQYAGTSAAAWEADKRTT